jgi:hypothetical protein
MPTYDFKCRRCGFLRENVLLRITHDDADKPCCCGDAMEYHISTPPLVHWVDPQIEAFRAVGVPGKPVVTSTRQNRELMARHDLVDANDLGPAPTYQDDLETNKKVQESIKAISPTAEQRDKMAKQGLLDPST